MQKTLLVTGASSGIGRATALLAASRGYAVAVHYHRQEAEAEAVVAQIRAGGQRALALHADLRSADELEQLYARVDRELGPLDAVVNSAGVGIARAPVAELKSADLERLMSLNVTGLILSCREASKRLSRSRGGRGGVIVNVSSMAATIGGRPGSAAYAASKAAVDAFTVGLAKELASEGVRAISVRPGMVVTEMTAAALAEPSFAATVAASIPLGRPAQVAEVAQPIVWLLSEEASFISGTCIDISGGGFHVACAPS